MGLAEMRALDDAKRAHDQALEAAAKAPKDEPSAPSGITTGEALAAMKRMEAIQVPGAPNRLPKELMLDASDAIARHPDKHLRWVNIKDPQKAMSRQLEGYTRLTSEEGGRTIGNELALMSIPKEKYEARIDAQRKRNRELLVAHKAEMKKVVGDVARSLRDEHGVQVDEKRLLVDE